MTMWMNLARSLKPMALASLNERCNIQTSTRTRVAGGGITVVFANVLTNVPCALFPAAVPQGEILTAEQLRAWNHWILKLPAETAIVEGQRVVISGTYPSGDTWTRTLEVLTCDGPKSFEVLRECSCRDILTLAGS